MATVPVATMDFNTLKNSRAARHVHIDRLIVKTDQDIANNDVPAVESDLLKLLDKELKLTEVTGYLHAKAPATEQQTEVEDDEAYSDIIIDCKYRCNRFLGQVAPAIAAANPLAPTIPVAAVGAAQVTPRVVAKLPKLQIAKYDGNLMDYERFWSQFDSGIHSNATLSKTDKFSYLISLLTDKVRLAIKGLSLTDANYDEAIRIITARYGKKDLLVSEHIQQLWRIRTVSQVGNGQELRLLFEEFNSHIQSLKSLGKDIVAMGPLLCHLLSKSLPKTILVDWNRKNAGVCNDDLVQLLDFVRQELESVEAAYRVLAETIKEKDSSHKRDNNNSNNRTSSTLLASTNSSKSNTTGTANSGAPSTSPYCFFCNEHFHTSTACPVYTTVRSRKECLSRAGRCFKCLRRNHLANACEQQIVCRFCSKKSHHTLLCEQREANATGATIGRRNNKARDTPANTRKTDSTTATAVTTEETEEQHTLVASSCTPIVKKRKHVSVLQTMRIGIRIGRQKHMVTMLVDGGSEKSFVSAAIVKRLGLKAINEKTTTINVFGGNQTQKTTASVNLLLEGENKVQFQLTALQVDAICHGVKLWDSDLIENYLENKNHSTWTQQMGPGETVTIDLLVGSDYIWKILTGHMKRLSGNLMATESIFGWMLQGSAEGNAAAQSITTMFVNCNDFEPPTLTVSQQLERLWELDKTGIMSKEDQSTFTLQDVEVLQHFEANTTYQENRYQVRIPWKPNKMELQPNFEIAKERLRRMLWKLSKDPVFYERYKHGIFEYLANGHSEEVSLTPTSRPVFYMPHHAIVREDRKTTKVRIVFDGSSCQEGAESLNTCQEAGPSLNPPIFSLLLRFRWEAVAMVSDIAKAFLQIFIHPDDRDALRFLWTDRPWAKNEEPQLRVFRMNRVLFGMRSSPFLLAATIRLHVKTHSDSDPELSQYISDRIYVDDLLSNSKNTHTAYTLFKRIHQLFLKGGMELTKWSTNDAQLRELWNHEGITTETDTIELLKILGIMWNPITDCLSIKSTNILEIVKQEPDTKRSMLKILASIFDPLGFLSPFTLIIKKLLQDLWKLKVDWDDAIPSKLLPTWIAWKAELELLPQIQVPRWLQTGEADSYQLHIFCDAGPRVYATVAYIRFQSSEGRWSSQLITAKSRLAPMKPMSIPRLELLACLVGSRLANSIQHTYSTITFQTQFWSDSTVALQWIKDVPHRWKLFVGRRVQEIQANSTVRSQWSYCPSPNNIADLLTRGQELHKLLDNQEWWLGPHWLRLPEEDWSAQTMEVGIEEEKAILQEEKSLEINIQVALIESPLIDENKFSSWQKYLRVTAWVQRFLHNCRTKDKNFNKFLTFKEIQEAEAYWFKYIQSIQFPEERATLHAKDELSIKSCIFQFQPFLDDEQLIRLGGRLQFANLTHSQHHPLLLKGGGMVDLLIQDRHFKTLHGGVQITLAKLRNEVWILKGRQAVRKAINSCMKCRKWNAKTACESEAQLPKARITETIAFQTVGLDFAGPVYVKDGETTAKAYICIFTCAVTRALHLELAASQTLQHFLLAFRRFVARRGGCKLVFSDNGSTYQQTDRLLRESYGHLLSSETQELAAHLGIEWRFIAPNASWWGGFYERMVKSVKFHLRRSLGAALLKPEELATLLTEIEAVINNRPLLHISEDPEDLEYLTPSHFLLGKIVTCLGDNLEYIQETSVKKRLVRRWKYRQQLLNRLWNSWKHDYLLQLRSAHTVKSARANQEPVKLGDVVLISNEKLPRGKWKMAKVVELTKGRDEKVRSVMLQTSNKTLLRRAIQHICPLEVID